MYRCSTLVTAVAGLVVAGAAHADVVLDWNSVLLDAIRAERPAPPVAARSLALVHVAVFDAVNGVVGGHVPYHVEDAAPAGAAPEAAAAAAAHRALVALFPARAAVFDAALAASLATIPDGPTEAAGVDWGVDVADAILALRSGDGADAITPYEAPYGGGWWAPTPPGFAGALLPNWPRVRPWGMAAGSQFRQDAPPCPNTAEYTLAFHEVRRLGRVDSALRTPDQTQIALFWADGPGTATPPGHWAVIAQELSRSRGLDLAENARLFALLGIAEADAAIVSWDHKYIYSHWRPVTAIQHADTDGNPETAADPAWTPLIATPPFPAYSSGHSTFSGSGARLLAHFFGGDEISFDAVSDALPGVVRSFSRLSDAAAEAGQSRIYGGIHWRYDNTAGLESGRQLADLVFFTQLRERAAPSACAPSPTVLCLDGGRFQVEARWATAENSGPAHTLQTGDDSGTLWFFHPDNSELLVKVVDGCGAFGRHWFFASGTTNVEVVITVTDTQTGAVRRYFNPPGKPFAPVQDVAAFACP